MINPGLDGKVALVTGANHGIGAATVKALAMQGVKVCLAYYREPSIFTPEELKAAKIAGIGGVLLYRANQQQSGELVIDEIRQKDGFAVAYEADLSDPDNIPELFDYCERELGPVDILVNNHTYCDMDTFDPEQVSMEGFGIHLTTENDLYKNFKVNTLAYVMAISEYTHRYLERHASWGRIINLSTDAAHAHPANISYAASKHAIESYSRSASIELGKYGITVNIVAPGPIQTGYITPNEEVSIATDTPLRRVGLPEDVADVIVFLASEQGRWITGQLIYVGGGWRIQQ